MAQSISEQFDATILAVVTDSWEGYTSRKTGEVVQAGSRHTAWFFRGYDKPPTEMRCNADQAAELRELLDADEAVTLEVRCETRAMGNQLYRTLSQVSVPREFAA